MIAAALVLMLSAPAPEPVAVMPFKNLNREASLEWMRLGVAETMIADLRKAGRGVVERDQIDKALAELASSDVDEASAAKAGKLVGAKTVVVGGYQKAGKELRITARFVAVETGVVLDTAKATGPIEKVFDLQDQIVDQLAGKAIARPKRKATAKTVKTYERYARTLVLPPEKRTEELRKIVSVDPDFVYASDDLRALEERMKGYASAALAKLAERERALLAKVEDPARAPEERLRDAKELLQALQEYRKFNTLLALSERIYGGSVPSEVKEYASACRVKAAFDLRKWDLALQYGETHLGEFPAGPHFKRVEGAMKTVIDTRKRWQHRRAEYESDRAEKLKDAATEVERDYAPCIAARWTSQENELMSGACGAFADKYAKSADPDVADDVEAARYFAFIAYTQLGDFAKAKPYADALLAGSSDWREPAEAILGTWPAD